MIDRLRGIWGFPPTPFADGRVDLRALAACVEHQARGGVDVLCACGAIAEVDSLSFEEWRACIEIVLSHAGGLPTVVTVPAWADPGAAAAEAAGLGADALLVLPRSPGTAETKQLLAALAAAAPGLPLVLYHRPPLHLGVEDLETLCEIEAFAGLKDGHRDVRLYRRLREAVGERLLWLSAWEDVALAFWAVGCDAFARAWLDHLEAGDVAGARRLLAAHAYLMVDLRLSRPGIEVTAVKAAMAELGLPSGEARPPASPLSPQERERVRSLTETLEALLEEPAVASSGAPGRDRP
jgi:dihydrodipicolinate synthase/N-acetylneuraminate lyase